MKIPKPSPDDIERFRAMVPDDERVEVKPMFGNLGAFVNGNMFMGLFGPAVGVKLSPADAAELGAIEGAGPFGPTERPMGGYLTIPAPLVGTSGGDTWARRALSHVATLPPKRAR